jgi:hypothetical protein
MTTITFDTLDLVDKLKTAGIPQEQAEAVVGVIADAQETLATKEYIDHKFDNKLASIYTDLAVLKWMMGFIMAGVLSIVVKTFF